MQYPHCAVNRMPHHTLLTSAFPIYITIKEIIQINTLTFLNLK